MTYLSLSALLEMIDEPYRTQCWAFFNKHRVLFETSRGSATKHQNWPCGYKDHITECLNIAHVTYRALEQLRPVPFSLSDALFSLYLHDIEKLWVHALDPADRAIPVDKEALLASEFTLEEKHLHAVKYTHGEGKDYHPIKRIQSPLAAFVHCCDTTSARVWFDHPKRKSTPCGQQTA